MVAPWHVKFNNISRPEACCRRLATKPTHNSRNILSSPYGQSDVGLALASSLGNMNVPKKKKQFALLWDRRVIAVREVHSSYFCVIFIPLINVQSAVLSGLVGLAKNKGNQPSNICALGFYEKQKPEK